MICPAVAVTRSSMLRGHTSADERDLCVANAPVVGSSGFLDPCFANALVVSPDLCDDTHDCSVATGDNYLKTLLTPILASPSYRAGKTAVIVVYDEFTPLPNVLMSKSVRPGTISVPVTHNLLLHTVESMLGLPWLVGNRRPAERVRAVNRDVEVSVRRVDGLGEDPLLAAAVTRDVDLVVAEVHGWCAHDGGAALRGAARSRLPPTIRRPDRDRGLSLEEGSG